MIRRLAMLAWTVPVWMALTERLSIGAVLGGVLASLLLLAVFPMLRRAGPPNALRPFATLRFGAYFSWKLFEASAIVAWEVVTPRSRINEGIVAVPIRGVSDLVATVVANAITLTPGTLTLEMRAEPPTLFVHVLHLDDLEEVRRDVRHLEALAIRAFGGAEALQWLRREEDGDVPLPEPRREAPPEEARER
ncbi:MAG TPA: Na+/H+ antiporter subunit E [Acidimicrobiia bacterium]|nr:Na+/H+ antiporter subunit E [Acidimicrobiia bacterium]